MHGPYFTQALNTINAGRWELLMARLFGSRSIGSDGLFTVEIRTWRGRSYLVKSTKVAERAAS